MVYREVGMWEILNVLQRIHRGESKSGVQRATGHDRKTISRYVKIAQQLGWEPKVKEPDEQLAAEVLQRIQPCRKEQEPGITELLLLAHKEKITNWLKGESDKKGLRLSKIHKILKRQGVDVPYSSLYRFAIKHCNFTNKRRLTVRVSDCGPGEVAQVDFGRLGLVLKPDVNQRKVIYALLVTLVYSRHQYVHITHSQKLTDFIDGIEDAWEFFGGVTNRVIIDNLKDAVTKADRYDPVFQRTFEEYAAYRNFVIDATVVRHPTGKPHVERNVPYVRENFFRGEQWLNRDHVQREVIRWCLEVAGTRVHGTTKRQPLGVFENTEKAVLKALDKARFDPPIWGRCKVHRDHHIVFQKAIYSVPTAYIGKEVDVRFDRKLVRIYVAGELIKVHDNQPAGGRSTDYNDYPEELAPYAMRNPEKIICEAYKHGDYIGDFMKELLSGPVPWSKLRQGQKLLRLGKKYGFSCVDQACRRALAFELINVKRVENIIEQNLERSAQTKSSNADNDVAYLPSRFQRSALSFVHRPEKERKEEKEEKEENHESHKAIKE